MNVKILILSFFCMTSFELYGKCQKNRADYVVVGLGTAGAVVAKKLSDDHNHSVIALHAGENLTQDPLIKFSEFAPITVAAGLVPAPPLYEGGETTPQINADNRILEWILSLPLGGASSINAGAYCRGTDQLYSQWEQIAGAEWSVSEVTRVYKELEKYNGETPNPEFRGYRGPLNIFQIPNPTQVAKKFTRGVMNATGLPFVLDYNDPLTPIGVSAQLQYTMKGKAGRLRVSSATAFLNQKVMTPEGHGVDGRKLTVYFESIALRVLWKGKKAIGVEYLQDGEIKQVFARKEVVLCAGLKSSFLLLHSGVGPASLLSSLSIPVVFDNPNVGQGLADQPGVRTIFTTNPFDTPENPPSGLFTQISWLPTPGGNPILRTLRLATANPVPGFALAILDLNRPLSRGFLTIASNDPLSKPIVNLGLLSNPADLDLMVQGFQIYLKNINQAMQAIDPLYQLVYPDPSILDDAALVEQFIKENMATNEHFQSHCRMAPLNQGGVVASNGAVHGVKKLRVADDSIVPLVMDGSPMASAYLIGYHIAELILKDHYPRRR